MLKIQILTKNNEKTLPETLGSLKLIDCKIIIGDLGSSDSTLDICSQYGADIKKIKTKNRSDARNSLLSEEMNMMIEPWEIVAQGHDKISECNKNSNVLLVNSNFASKELRIWKNLKFRNPVYETLEDNSAKLLEDVVLISKNAPDHRQEEEELCLEWKDSRPTDIEAWYYCAFSALRLGKNEEFLKYAERYLAMTKKFGPAEVQINYIIAQVLLKQNKLEDSAKFCLKCISMHPTFSEFWCLLGDIFIKNNQYLKAKSMYTNAIEIGKIRSSSDSHPVEIDKYLKYPKSKLDMINKIIDEINKQISNNKSK